MFTSSEKSTERYQIARRQAIFDGSQIQHLLRNTLLQISILYSKTPLVFLQSLSVCDILDHMMVV
ncbi:hypothetical protein PHLCEN_2v220 [Hermanssonia centrifuga]|uniref:Uncharacterized protein n=1 Tax=Hermanssonia centrifuga TaxID=98765 RepID=A0A2R6S6L6_9APHY|nr:hypothetical protein PHLCEN_2v220 [Hermanssonia centrifuga]